MKRDLLAIKTRKTRAEDYCSAAAERGTGDAFDSAFFILTDTFPAFFMTHFEGRQMKREWETVKVLLFEFQKPRCGGERRSKKKKKRLRRTRAHDSRFAGTGGRVVAHARLPQGTAAKRPIRGGNA